MEHNVQRAKRNKHLVHALSTSFLARAAGILLQVVSLPIAAASLGPEGFSVFSMLGVILAWLSLSNLGIAQATTLHMSREPNSKYKVNILSASLVVVAIASTIVLMAGLLIAYFTPVVRWMFERHVDDIGAVYAPLYLCALVFFISQYLSVFEAAQLSAQRQALYNVLTTFGTALAAAAVYFVSDHNATVISILIAVHLPVLFVRIINTVVVYRQIEFKISYAFSTKKKYLQQVLRDGVHFVTGGSISNFLCHPLSIVLVGVSAVSVTTASFAAVMNAVILSASVFGFIMTPFRGALPEAHRRGDIYWIFRMYILTLSVNIGYSIVPCILLSYFGYSVFEAWYQGSVSPHKLTLIAAGIYMVLLAVEVTNYNFLASLGRVRTASRWLLVKAVVTVFIVWILASLGLVDRVFTGIVIVNLIFCILPLSFLVFQFFQSYSEV